MTSSAPQVVRPIEILLVEDNPVDIELTRDALESYPIMNNLHVVTDGEAAIRFLRQQKEYADAPRPDLVLLDLKLPKRNGWEILEDIKKDDILRRTPIVILTTSHADEDVVRAYDMNANALIRKPVQAEDFLSVVLDNANYWLNIVKLPGHEGGLDA